MANKKNRVLLVGNGLNLVSDQGARWDALLNKLAGKAKTKREKEVRNAKPFTLWFEEIASNKKTNELKEEISMYLAQYMRPNIHHAEIMNLGYSNILTTNYDYNLEKAIDDKWKSNYSARETYYSLFRRRTSGKQHVWHIHGELNNISSIMLGHAQYSGYTHKIRNYLSSGVITNVKERNGMPYKSKYAREGEEGKGYVPTWVDLFLEKDVDIVGFGFDYTENHLWNLLMKKQKLRSKKLTKGNVVYHRCSTRKQTAADEAKLSILTALGVDVKDYVEHSYEKAYSRCINNLE